jgi:hypothetical protein
VVATSHLWLREVIKAKLVRISKVAIVKAIQEPEGGNALLVSSRMRDQKTLREFDQAALLAA